MALSQAELDIVIKSIAENQGLEQVNQQLAKVSSETEKTGASAKKAEFGIKDLTGALQLLGIGFGIQQGISFTKELVEVARAADGAKAALVAAIPPTTTYEQAINAAKAATNGMASEQQLAASLTTIFGAGLAKNAQDAAQLANAGTILTNVFAAAGATQDLYVRLLSSGSIQLYNNFGITQAMVKAKQDEIEATTNLSGEEARLAAVKAALIDNARKYQAALTDDATASAQFEAASQDAKAALGELILPEVTEGIKNLGWTVRGTADYLESMGPSARNATTGLIELLNPLATLNSVVTNARASLAGLTQTNVQAAQAAAQAAAQVVIAGRGYDETAAAVQNASGDVATFQQALLSNVGNYAEYQAAVDRVAQSNIFLAGQLDLTSEQFDRQRSAMSEASGAAESLYSSQIQTKEAIDAEVSSLGPLNSSLEAMGFSAQGALEAVDPLTRGLIEQSQAARDAAAASREFAAAKREEAIAAGAPSTNREIDAYRQLAEARAGTVETQAQFAAQTNQQRIAEQQRQEEQATRESERRATQQAQVITRAFDKVGSDIASAVSGAVSQSTTDIAGLLGLNAEGEQRVNEGVRRMAAVATGGLANEWTQQLATQLQGVDAAAAFVNAVRTGNNEATMAEARKLALNPIVELFDANAIAGRIEQQLRAQQLQQVLNDKVNALLGERGLQAVQTVTQQVSTAVDVTSQAATTANTSLANIGVSAEQVGGQVGAAFTSATGPINTLNSSFRLMLGLLDQITQKAGVASGNISAMNPPQAGPSDASKKQGPLPAP